LAFGHFNFDDEVGVSVAGMEFYHKVVAKIRKWPTTIRDKRKFMSGVAHVFNEETRKQSHHGLISHCQKPLLR
jgi:hypothetical protein